MNCPNCGSFNIQPRGDRRSCKDCGKWFTPGAKNPGTVGRPCVGDKPLTPYQKLRRHLDKKKNSENP